MRREALVRLPADGGEASWLTCTEGGGDCGHVARGDLATAGRETAACRVAVLVPSTEVLLTEISMPRANRRQMLRAIPFALEERLAADVDGLHFAPGDRDDAGSVAVAVVDRGRMDRWHECLDEADMRPERMVPDALALPLSDGEWTVLLERDRVLVRQGTARGFAAEPDDLEALLSIALEQAGEDGPAKVRLLDCGGGGLAETVAAVCERAGVAVEREYGSDGAVFLARGVHQGGIDLLQGDYSRREQVGRLLRPWRPAAALLGVLVAVQGVMAGYDLHRLRQEEQRLDTAIEQVYRTAFPDSRVVNPRVQMEQRLQSLQKGDGGGGFVGLMNEAAPELARAQGVELQGMRYRNGLLEFDLVLKDLQALDRLKQALTKDEMLNVEIETASARGDRVESRIRVQGREK